jgi:hypothetical protein
MTGVHHHTQRLVEVGSHKLFACAGLELVILPISTSQVGRITGVSHWCPAESTFVCKKKKRLLNVYPMSNSSIRVAKALLKKTQTSLPSLLRNNRGLKMSQFPGVTV